MKQNPLLPVAWFAAAAAAVFFSSIPCSQAAVAAVGTPGAARKPNILLIVADDLGYGDLGCFGCKDIPTPNIDKIARGGLKFTDAYAYSVCSPTRAALLTGQYAERYGIHGPLMGSSIGKFAQAKTIAITLHEAGYVTGLVGKWHLGYDKNVLPTHMGFDEFYGFHGGKLDYFKHTDSTQKNGTPEGKHDFWEGDKEIFPEGYTTDLFTGRATQFIRDHATVPFFLELAYNAPHYASKKGDYEAPEIYLKRFHVEGDPKMTRGGYAAMVSCMDDGIGRVLAELSAQKLDEKTLVIFISDNGAECAGSNAPFTGGKHTLLEGGIRVPWAMRWPGVISPGTVCKSPVHVIDIAPTLVALSGATPRPDFDGINLLPAITGNQPVPTRPLYFELKALREGQFKLRDGKIYDINADPKEKSDVAASHPEIFQKLTSELQAWHY